MRRRQFLKATAATATRPAAMLASSEVVVDYASFMRALESGRTFIYIAKCIRVPAGALRLAGG